MKNKLITQFFSLNSQSKASTTTTIQQQQQNDQQELESPGAKKRRSCQTFLNLGQSDFFKTCKECQMTWNSAEETDVNLHKRYHKFFVTGIVFRPNELSKLKCLSRNTVYSIYTNIVAFGTEARGKSSDSWLLGKNNTILKFINIELGCSSLQLDKRQINDYIFYFAIANDSGALVGYLLAKTIQKAHVYNFNETAGEFVDLNAPVPASLGISRIWTAFKWRRKGIATSLLSVATKGKNLNEVAFSQPTSLGKKLFIRFLGGERLLVFLDK